MSRQRVLLLGRHGLLAQGVRDILERQSDMEISGPHAPSMDAVAHIKEFDPDVIVITSEGPTDAALVARIVRTCPDLPVVCVGLEEAKRRIVAYGAGRSLSEVYTEVKAWYAWSGG